MENPISETTHSLTNEQYSSRLNRLRIRHLRLLDSIARTGSLTAAASAMRMSQPAVTKMLQEVESIFSVALVARGTRGTSLTKEGEYALDRLRLALAHIDAAVVPVASESVPLLRVGMLPLFSLELLPLVVKQLQNGQRRMRLNLSEDSLTELLRRLSIGEIDCILGGLDHPKLRIWDQAALRITPIYSDEMVFICGHQHPLARKRHVKIADIHGLNWALLPGGTYTRNVFMETFHQSGLTPPEPLVEANSLQVILNMVSQSDFCTLAPGTAVNAYSRRGLVARLRIPGSHGIGSLALISLEAMQIYQPFKHFEKALIESVKCLWLDTQNDTRKQ